MRKHSKFITILLSALLAVCLVQTVFVQAFATEMGDDDFGWGNASTSDEAETVYPVSMKVVKAPESITVNQDRITDSTFWSNVVLHIVYSNGEEYDVNCDGIGDSYENGIVPPIPEIDGYSGRIYIYSESMLDNYLDNDVAFHLHYRYGVDSELVDEGGYDGIFIETEFSVKKKVDPHTIAKCEVTKLPDKVFTAPLFTAEDEPLESLDVKNSISHNIDGMEITYYYANGEKGGTVTFNSSMLSEDFAPVAVRYGTQDLDEYGNYIRIEVHDKGNYKFSVEYLLGNPNISAQILTAKSASNPNPSIKPVSTIDTPAKPSGNISSATSDVATKDNAGNNNSTNGTANNGVVATGDFATPAIIATVMILAAAVMFVLKRKHTF